MITSYVKEIMEEKKVSIRAMAHDTKLSDATILRARRDILQCRLSTLKTISDYLGCEIKDLFKHGSS